MTLASNEDGWFDPQCPHCNGIMSINYNKWLMLDSRKFFGKYKYPDFRMYCMHCHYAVEVKPSTIDHDANFIARTDVVFTPYNDSVFEEELEEDEDPCICIPDEPNTNCPSCY